MGQCSQSLCGVVLTVELCGAPLQNFSTVSAFLSSFERYCSSQASVARLRAHPSYSAFLSKWTLPVYFQLR